MRSHEAPREYHVMIHDWDIDAVYLCTKKTRRPEENVRTVLYLRAVSEVHECLPASLRFASLTYSGFKEGRGGSGPSLMMGWMSRNILYSIPPFSAAVSKGREAFLVALWRTVWFVFLSSLRAAAYISLTCLHIVYLLASSDSTSTRVYCTSTSISEKKKQPPPPQLLMSFRKSFEF